MKLLKLSKLSIQKIKKSKNESRISQLKRMRKELLNRYSSLGETFVDTDDEKTETLDKLLNLDRKLAGGEIKKTALVTRERNKLIKKFRSLCGNYDWAKRTV